MAVVPKSVLVMLVAVCIVGLATLTPNVDAITCGQVSSGLSQCLGYLRNGGAIPSACCSGVKGLNSAATTPADRKTACACLKSLASSIEGINYSLASSLPSNCGVSIPYKISPSTDCNRVN